MAVGGGKATKTQRAVDRTKSGLSVATSSGAAPAHWVASTTSAAPTSLHRAAIASSGIVVPSNQKVGVIATTAVSASIRPSAASPQLPPHSAGGGTTRIAAPVSAASCCQTNRFEVCSPPSETTLTDDDSRPTRFRAATAIPSAMMAEAMRKQPCERRRVASVSGARDGASR